LDGTRMRHPLSATAIAVEWHRDRAVDIYKSRSLGRALCLPKDIEAENRNFPMARSIFMD